MKFRSQKYGCVCKLTVGLIPNKQLQLHDDETGTRGSNYSIPIRDSNRIDSIRYANRFESIRFVKKSAFRFTSCHAVFALNK